VLTWFGLVFVGSAIFGLFLGLNAQTGLVRRIPRWCHLNPVHVMPTAWDWKFSAMTEQWVLCSAQRWDEIRRFLRSQLVHVIRSERDLYIERAYDLDAENIWHPRENGILIAAGEIRTIEFWPST